jgi:putative SOS response-associated peptidase YedK
MPNELMSEIHDRMPLILSPETCDCWLTNIDPTRTTC